MPSASFLCSARESGCGSYLRRVRRFPACSRNSTSPSLPPRYNEALLIKELEEKGIGRPSTYASIISTIQDRKYAEKVDGRFAPTETGRTVNNFLMKGFPDLINVDFTSHMEEELDEVEEGNKPWVTAVREFYGTFTMDLEKAKTIPGPKDTVEPPTDIPCEKCGQNDGD